jgi:hypothetical protein
MLLSRSPTTHMASRHNYRTLSLFFSFVCFVLFHFFCFVFVFVFFLRALATDRCAIDCVRALLVDDDPTRNERVTIGASFVVGRCLLFDRDERRFNQSHLVSSAATLVRSQRRGPTSRNP